MFYLWRESDQERARNSLRQMLHGLRRDLQAPDLFIGLATVRLNPLVITSDVCDFADALKAGDLSWAAGLYRGAFLDGFHITGAPDFEHWVDEHRLRLAREFTDVLEKLAAKAHQEGDPAAAVAHLRRLAAMEPLDPTIAAGLVQALVTSGDLAGALEHAKAHQAVVFEELGGELDSAVASLVARIRAGEFGSASRRSAPHPALDVSSRGDILSPDGLAPETEPAMASAIAQPSSLRQKLITMLLLIFGGVAVAFLRGRNVALDGNLVAVAPYQVLDSPLSAWKEGVMDVLSRNLDKAGPLRTVAPQTVVSRWRGRVDKESATGLGRATGARFVILGTIGRAGPDSVRATTMAVDASTGAVLREIERRQSATRMGLLTDSLTVAILNILSEHVSIGVFGPGSLGAVSSLEAVKDFLTGEQFYRQSGWDSASVYYQRAVDKDSSFALALYHLGNVLAWQHLITDTLSSSYLLRAGALNRGLSPLDSVLIQADSLTAAILTTSEELLSWRLGRRLFGTLSYAVERYPEAPETWFALGEAQYHFGGGPIVGVPDSTVLRSFARSISLDSTFGPAYLHAVELGLNVGDTALGLRYLRDYMRVTPGASAPRSIQLVRLLLDTPVAQSTATQQLLDSLDPNVLVSARTILRRWADSAETAVRLSRLLAGRQAAGAPPILDTALMKQRLAEELAFRGHLHEAATVADNRDLRIVAELAFLGALPVDTAQAIFGRWLRRGSVHRELALAWWSSRGDTAAIRDFLRRADRDVDAAQTEDERLTAEYASAAAKAHWSLATGDTLHALRRFLSLPDSLCPTCYLDRLTRARLLAAAGRDRAALKDLSEPLHAFLTPLEVVYALERARLAQRVGETERSRRDSAFVARAWRHGDLELLRPITGRAPVR